MSNIRIGFVGVGGMGQAAHLRNYMSTPGCQVVAIAEKRANLGRKVADRHGIEKVYPSHVELFANEQLDGIVASQPFGFHVELVPQLLQKGVPVITEKPLADTLENGEKILSAVRKTNGRLFIGYNKRSDPATAFALKQIQAWKESGEVGRLKYIRVSMPPGDWVANGFAFNNNVGSDEPYSPKGGMDTKYGNFVNFYIHQVNLIRLLLGEDYRVTFADPGKVLLVGRSDSGVTVTLEIAAYTTTVDWQETALVTFDHGWVQLELPPPMAYTRAGRVSVFRDPGNHQTPTITTPVLPCVHSMWQQAMNFVAACRGEKTVLCTPDDALKDLQVAKSYIDLLEKTQQEFGVPVNTN